MVTDDGTTNLPAYRGQLVQKTEVKQGQFQHKHEMEWIVITSFSAERNPRTRPTQICGMSQLYCNDRVLNAWKVTKRHSARRARCVCGEMGRGRTTIAMHLCFWLSSPATKTEKRARWCSSSTAETTQKSSPATLQAAHNYDTAPGLARM